MTSSSRNKPAQRAHSSNHVSFGQFGTATYDVQSQEWTFLRENAPKSQSRGSAEPVAPPFRHLRDPVRILGDGSNSNSSSRHSTGNKLSNIKLLNTAAEAASVIAQPDVRSYVNRLRQQSKRPQEFILAFGSAMVLGVDDVPSGFAALPVAAFVKPDQPSRLFLTTLSREVVQASLDSDESVNIRFPIISDQEPSSWSSDGDPIKSVQFSTRSIVRRGTWLAVRRSSFVNIFQPVYHRVETASDPKTEFASSLELDSVVEISSTYTGNQPFADVAFNPHKPRRFVIVDVAGNWSIWKLLGAQPRSTRVSRRVQLVVSGHTSTDPESLVQFDGWHKTAWLSSGGESIDRFIICNRQSVWLFDLQGNTLSEVDLRIGSRFAGSILDFVTTTSYNNIFLLTESYIFNVSTAGNGNALTEDHNGLVVLSYWNHFRGDTNETLRIHVVQSSYSIWLFLTDTSSSILTAYKCVKSQSDDSTPFSISDPSWLNLSSLGVPDLQVLSFQAVAAQIARPKEHLTTCFFKVFLQNASGHVFDTLHQLTEPVGRGPGSEHQIALPNMQLLRHKSASHVQPLIDDEELEDFIVADSWNDVDSVDGSEHDTLDSQDSRPLQTVSSEEEDVPELMTCDLQRTYDLVVSGIEPPPAEARTNSDTMFRQIQQHLDEVSCDACLCSKLVLELPVSIPYVAEIEDDSRALESWFFSYALAERGTEFARGRRFRTTGKSLLEIYDDMVKLWISPLSDLISSRFRVQRERLIRQIALEVVLSSATLEPATSTHKDVDRSDHSENRDSNVAADSSSAVLSSSKHDNAVGADMLSSSPPDTYVRTQKEQKRKRSVLSQYVQFTPPPIVNDKSEAIAENILSHLPQSADRDPVSYSYDDTELNLALAQNEVMTQEMDPKTRRKAEKLSRVHRKKMEKQAQSKKVAFEQSMAIPSVMSSQLPLRGVQSSQIAAPVSSQLEQGSVPQVSMTQPERGMYGTRESTKPKIKGKAGRRKGF